MEDRLRTNETVVIDFFIKYESFVVETKGRVPDRVGKELLETDDGLAEKGDGSVSFAVKKAKTSGLVESQVEKEIKSIQHVQWRNKKGVRNRTEATLCYAELQTD